MTPCGYRTGVVHDPARRNWYDTGPRPIAWSAWYPSAVSTYAGPMSEHFFDPGTAIRNAPIAPGVRMPVVLLSHGTGGTAESLGWIARALVQAGCVVVGANHHGNTGHEEYLAQGFLCWWERAADMSFLLTTLTSEGFFADSLALDRVNAVGFSLGGHSVLSLAGARNSLDLFDAWRENDIHRRAGPK